MHPYSCAIDNSAILYLALIRRDHTNVFRFSLTMSETIDPVLLQKAVDRVYHRFPTIFSGFRPGFFRYTQVQAEKPPLVQPDPGCLITMTREEIARCAYRIYYRDSLIIVECFHAVCDGYGNTAAFSTLAAEYLQLKYGLQIPAGYPIMPCDIGPQKEELEDSYLRYADAKPLHMPSRYSFQLPGKEASHDVIHEAPRTIPLSGILSAARRHGTSMTALLSAVMAQSVMEVQLQSSPRKVRPVRIMVPIDLRRIFPSNTFRNFILYALPTMEPEENALSLQDLAQKFSRQIKAHIHKENLAGIIAYNVKTQASPLFKLLPAAFKCWIMRLAYRFFGESNSSITLTNLGDIALPEVMIPYIKSVKITLTPRARSPYNCSMMSYNGQFMINISRFPEASELEALFYGKIQKLLDEVN